MSRMDLKSIKGHDKRLSFAVKPSYTVKRLKQQVMLVESVPFPEQVGLCASESRFKFPPSTIPYIFLQVLELNGMVLADSQRR